MRYEEILPGLGDRFEAEVRAALLRTVELPESAPVYAGDFRRLLVRKYDHGIFYRIHGARMVVTAVLDLRQDPTTIRRPGRYSGRLRQVDERGGRSNQISPWIANLPNDRRMERLWKDLTDGSISDKSYRVSGLR